MPPTSTSSTSAIPTPARPVPRGGAVRAAERAARPLARLATERPGRRAVIARRVFTVTTVLVWLAVAGTLLAWGFQYYATPLQQRAYSDYHELLKPSGLVGQGYGVIGTLMMVVGVAGYSLRRRVRWLSRLGKLKTWLGVHIFLCTMGPFLIVLHTTFKFGGIVSIAFWSMVAVVTSGVFGRYLYVRIPKTLNGQFLSLQTIEQQRGTLLQNIATRSGLSPAEIDGILRVAKRPARRGFAGALFQSAWYDLTEGAHDRKIQRALAAKGVPPNARAAAARLFRDEARLEHQVALLQPFQRLFKYWHLFHMPLAIVMLVIVLVHVSVAVLLGYTWLF
jgi:hypothetical protein